MTLTEHQKRVFKRDFGKQVATMSREQLNRALELIRMTVPKDECSCCEGSTTKTVITVEKEDYND
jgi:hypothetical protein